MILIRFDVSLIDGADRNHPWRVFETVKVVNKAARLRSRCHSPVVPGSSPMSNRSSRTGTPRTGTPRTSTPRTSYYGSDNVCLNVEDKTSSNHAHKEDNRSIRVCVHDDDDDDDAQMLRDTPVCVLSSILCM